MIRDLIVGLGMVAIFEGLLLAMAPRHLQEALDLLLRLTEGQRRTLALSAIALGVFLVWLAR